MSTNKQVTPYTVSTLGTNAGDNAMFEQVFAVTRTATPAIDAYTFRSDKPADIVLIKSSNAHALRGWQAYCTLNPSAAAAVSIWYGSAIPPGQADYHLPHPASVGEVADLLKQIVKSRLESSDQEGLRDSQLLAEATDTGAIASTAPPAASPIEPVAVEPAPRPDSEQGPPGIKALLVCGGLPTEIQLKTALSQLADQIQIVRTGEEALVMLAGNAFDIVFVDVILPGMDGHALCEAIRELHAQLSIPIVMLTSNSMPADKMPHKTSGCDAYLIKPVHRPLFEEIVRGLLHSRRAIETAS